MPDFTPPFASRESQASISVSDAQGRQVCSWPLGTAGERAREGARRKARMVVEALNAQARDVEIDRLRAENERLLALLRKCREAFMYVPPATTLTYASGGTVSEPIPVRLVPHPGLLAEIDAALGVGADG
jgi:hypothetical protein